MSEFWATEYTKLAAGYRRDVILPLRQLQQSYAKARGLTPPKLVAGVPLGIMQGISHGIGPSASTVKAPTGVQTYIDTRLPSYMQQTVADQASKGRPSTPLSIAGHEMAHGFQASDPSNANRLGKELQAARPLIAPAHDNQTRQQGIEIRKAHRDIPDSVTGPRDLPMVPYSRRNPELHADQMGRDFQEYVTTHHPDEAAALARNMRFHDAHYTARKQPLFDQDMKQQEAITRMRQAHDIGDHEAAAQAYIEHGKMFGLSEADSRKGYEDYRRMAGAVQMPRDRGQDDDKWGD